MLSLLWEGDCLNRVSPNTGLLCLTIYFNYVLPAKQVFVLFVFLNVTGWSTSLLIAFGMSTPNWHDRVRLPMRQNTCPHVKKTCPDDVLLQSILCTEPSNHDNTPSVQRSWLPFLAGKPILLKMPPHLWKEVVISRYLVFLGPSVQNNIHMLVAQAISCITVDKVHAKECTFIRMPLWHCTRKMHKSTGRSCHKPDIGLITVWGVTSV